VAHAAVLSHEHSAGLDSRAGIELCGLSTCQTVEQLDRGLVVPTVEPLLDAPRDHAAQQILGEGRWRFLTEHLAPPCPEIGFVEGSQFFNLSPDVGFLGIVHHGDSELRLRNPKR
jgi:hypothetical protein